MSHRLERDSFGRLVFIDEHGNAHVGAYPVRAFPITAPAAGLSIMDQSGKELCWFPAIAAIPESELALIEEEIAAREFMPVIERINKVSTFAISTPIAALRVFASRVRRTFVGSLVIHS